MSGESVQIDDISVSTEEVTETLRAIRAGSVDAVVVNAPNGHAVLTFRDPDAAYRALVEGMGEGAALVTREGIVTYHNPRFAELLTGGAAVLRGRTLGELVASDAMASISSMLERAQLGPARIEVTLGSRETAPVPVQLTASVASVADVPVLCVIATDLSEQRAQAELYRNALIGMEARERLLSIAGHELRTPLQALVFDIGVLLDRQRSVDGESTDQTVAQLHAIHRQALQLAHLVGNLLDVGLLGTGRLELRIEEVDLAELVATAAERSDDLARSGSSITLACPPVRGQWDRVRLDQVATNLISNAAKYGLGKPIRVSLSSDDRITTLVVEDEGIGLTPEAIDRLFLPFERVGSVKSATGLGLGLYVTAQIVNAHGGVIRVESSPGAGSKFVVELPRRRRQP